LTPEAGETSLVVSAIAKPSKRRQIRHTMSHVSTPSLSSRTKAPSGRP
jgi:hypothetical protein